METNKIEFYVGEQGYVPIRGEGDAGFDFFVPVNQPSFVLSPGEGQLINTHIRAKLPVGIALVAFNKSGVATKKHLQVGACVVDRSYQGEIHIHVFNWGTEPVTIDAGDKLVQFVPLKINDEEALYSYEATTKLEDFFPTKTNRGEGGFGSTGDKA